MNYESVIKGQGAGSSEILQSGLDRVVMPRYAPTYSSLVSPLIARAASDTLSQAPAAAPPPGLDLARKLARMSLRPAGAC